MNALLGNIHFGAGIVAVATIVLSIQAGNIPGALAAAGVLLNSLHIAVNVPSIPADPAQAAKHPLAAAVIAELRSLLSAPAVPSTPPAPGVPAIPPALPNPVIDDILALLAARLKQTPPATPLPPTP